VSVDSLLTAEGSNSRTTLGGHGFCPLLSSLTGGVRSECSCLDRQEANQKDPFDLRFEGGYSHSILSLTIGLLILFEQKNWAFPVSCRCGRRSSRLALPIGLPRRTSLDTKSHCPRKFLVSKSLLNSGTGVFVYLPSQAKWVKVHYTLSCPMS